VSDIAEEGALKEAVLGPQKGSLGIRIMVLRGRKNVVPTDILKNLSSRGGIRKWV